MHFGCLGFVRDPSLTQGASASLELRGYDAEAHLAGWQTSQW